MGDEKNAHDNKTEDQKTVVVEETKTEHELNERLNKNTPVKLNKADESNLLKVNLRFNTFQEFKAFCKEIAGDTKLSPLSSEQDVMIALLAGASLGIPIPTALNNIVPVNGKATLSNNLQMGLLATEGIIPIILEDAKPIYTLYHYQYDEETGEPKQKEGKPIILEKEFLFRSDLMKRIDEYNELVKANELTEAERKMMKPKIKWVPVGHGTKVRLERKVKQPDGSWKDYSVERMFTTLDAENIQYVNKATGKMESVLESKDAWKNYKPDLLYANAFRRSAKIIGNDLLMNLNSTEEMLDTTNINYELHEEGSIILKDKDGNTIREIKTNV